jgi:HSP20 family molecular chaperone IbpA
MTTITRRRIHPFADLVGWLESDPSAQRMGLAPLVRVEDFFEDGTYVLRAEMPGIDPEQDLDITVDGDVLTIRGERREEKKDKERSELHYGSFSRTLTLPRHAKVDDIAADYADGVLTLKVPMGGPAEAPRKVSVHRTERE